MIYNLNFRSIYKAFFSKAFFSKACICRTCIAGMVCLLASLSNGLTHSLEAQTQTVDFESLPVPSTGFFNGDTNGSAAYRSNFQVTGSRDNFGEPETLQLWGLDGLQFFNGYTPAFGSWNGWSWSNVVDNTTTGFGNQYASFPGGGSDGTGGVSAGETYAVGFGSDSFINLPDSISLTSVDVANTTYAATSMRDGDSFTDAFGGADGNEPDFFRVTVTGYDDLFIGDSTTGNQIGFVEIYLADFRFADNNLDFISDSWNQLDLSPIANSRSIQFSFASSDPFTPTYAAIDNLSFEVLGVPEPSGILVFVSLSIGLVSRRRRTAQK